MQNEENDSRIAAHGEPPPPRSVQDTVLRNSALLGIVFVFNLFAGLITSSLLTHLLGRDLYGVYGNYFRLYSWLATISAFILPPVIVRYVAELIGAGRVGRTWRLLKVSLWLQAANILVVFAAYLIFALLTKQFGGVGATMLAAIFVASTSRPRTSTSDLQNCRARGRPTYPSPTTAIFIWVGSPLAPLTPSLIYTAEDTSSVAGRT